MSAELNPAELNPSVFMEDRGSFVITDEMMGRVDFRLLEEFQQRLYDEAARRGLVLYKEHDILSRDTIISWEPAQ